MPTTGPGGGWVLRVLVFWCDWGALGLAIGPDQFRRGVAHFSGHSFDLGAGFRLLSILKGGDRFGDVLLHFLQLGKLQRLEIVISHAMRRVLNIPVSIARRGMVPQLP